MRYPLLILAAASVALAACGSDNGSTTGTGPGGTTSSAVFTVSFDSGSVDSATAPAGSVVKVRIHVKRAGVGVPSMVVTWGASSGGAVAPTTTVTDSLGATSAFWTLGDTIGVNSVSAVSGDGSATLHALATAGAPSDLRKVSLDTMSVVAGGAVPLTARITDRFGNPVNGATLLWSTNTGRLSAASTTSGTSGNSSVTLTTVTAGTYFVTAALPNSASVTFKVTAF
jgi:hypothetical protein